MNGILGMVGQRNNKMANLFRLIHDEKYADEMANKFADLVEQDVNVPKDKNIEINFTNKLIKMFERAGTQSPKSYQKFYTI